MNKIEKTDNSLDLDENINQLNQLNINANEFYPKNHDLLFKKPPILINTKKNKIYQKDTNKVLIDTKNYERDTNKVLMNSIRYVLNNE